MRCALPQRQTGLPASRKGEEAKMRHGDSPPKKEGHPFDARPADLLGSNKARPWGSISACCHNSLKALMASIWLYPAAGDQER
jgi:hypothetical protein